MRISFGLALDSGAWPDELASAGPTARASFGTLALGPRGLLALLETHLGLPRAELGRSVRVAAMQSAVAARRGTAFYDRSYAVDPLGVAEFLLARRDELVLAGWTGAATTGAGQGLSRVRELAALETPFQEACARAGDGAASGAGFPDRLADAVRELRQRDAGTPVLPIARIECVTPASLLPGLWREVLDVLQAGGAELSWTEPPPPAASPDSDLGRIQAALEEGSPKAEVRADGSLAYLRAASPGEAAELVAALAAQPVGTTPAADAGQPAPSARPAVGQGQLWPPTRAPASAANESTPVDTAPARGQVVLLGPSPLHDTALAAAGLPRTGARQASPFRPASQLLPLSLSMLRAPLDPERLVAFCELPLNPLRDRTRDRLRLAVLDHPGRGGAAWHRALGRAVDDLGPRDAARERELVDTWLDAPTVPAGQPLPVARVLDVTERVSAWLAERLQERQHSAAADDPLELGPGPAADQRGRALDRQLDDALRCTHDLRAVLATRTGNRRDTIEDGELHALLDLILADVRATELAAAEAGPLIALASPAQLHAPVDTLIWCSFAADAWPTPTPSPWSADERSELARRGAHLPDPEAQSEAAYREAQRALRLVRRRVLLVGHGLDDEAVHPLWHVLAARCVDEPSADRLVTQGRPDRLAQQFPGTALGELPSAPPEARAPRSPHRIWRIAADVADRRRPVESHNSLSKLVDCPLQWLLGYHVPAGELSPTDTSRPSPGPAPDAALPESPSDASFREDELRATGRRFLRLDRATEPRPRDGPLLFGTLAHRLVEEVFADFGPNSDPDALRRRAEARLEQLLPSEAAQLLLPGREHDREDVERQIGRAVAVLAQHLLDADAQRVQLEYPAQLDTDRLGPIQGHIDLVARLPSGPAIVDLKWGAGQRYKELQKGRATQLALYRHLLGDHASVAYFTLKNRRMLPLANNAFPGVTPIDGPSSADTFTRFAKSIEAARETLAAGVVTATCIDDGQHAGGTPVTDGLAVREITKVCEYCSFTALCGLRQQHPRSKRQDSR